MFLTKENETETCTFGRRGGIVASDESSKIKFLSVRRSINIK